LDWLILWVFSNLGDSMILRYSIVVSLLSGYIFFLGTFHGSYVYPCFPQTSYPNICALKFVLEKAVYLEGMCLFMSAEMNCNFSWERSG